MYNRQTILKKKMELFVTTVLVSLFGKCVSGLQCPMMYRAVGTVCGTDGVTYPTLCELEVARAVDPALDMAYFGKCTTYCKNTWEPVCGNDLVTYSNLCLLEIEARKHSSLEVLHEGKCWSGDDFVYDKDKKTDPPQRKGKLVYHDKKKFYETAPQDGNQFMSIETKVNKRPRKKIPYTIQYKTIVSMKQTPKYKKHKKHNKTAEQKFKKLAKQHNH